MRRTSHRELTAAIEAAASNWIVRRESGLSEKEQRDYATWLAADPRHLSALRQLEQTWTMLDRPRAAGRADEMAGELQLRVTVRRRQRIMGVATLMAIALVATTAMWHSRVPVEISQSPVSAIVVAPEMRTLPDGTVVELRPGADIIVDFSGPLRRVVLRRGEALFHVARDANRAFVVSAAEVEVRAVGTAFVVQMEKSGIQVVVTEGRVAVGKAAVAAPDRAGEGELNPESFSAMVGAGERIQIGKVAVEAQPVTMTADEIADRLAWRATRIEFSNTPLAEAVGLMNRHSNLQLVVDDPKLAGVRVNGLFRADNTETLVRLLEASFDVKAERSGNTILLRRAR